MARKQRKYHFIYKTVCDVTNKFYIGMHSTDNMDDGYLGSGKRLWYSLNKYGKDNHSIEVLEYCNNRKELKLKEAEIVNNDLLNEDMCMNLALGGHGGHGSKFLTKEQLSKGGKISAKMLNDRKKNDLVFREKCRDASSKNIKKQHKTGKIKYGVSFKNKQHSEETKNKISDIMKTKGSGNTNSQFGTCWITRGGENKKIKKEDLEIHTIDGWVRGRK